MVNFFKNNHKIIPIFIHTSSLGFGLLELLVALFLLSAGLLSMATTQYVALHYTQEAYWQSLAATQLVSLYERLQLSQSDSIQSSELIRWRTNNSRLLPTAESRYQCVTQGCTAYISWKDRGQMYELQLFSAH